jgi:hypothetical protein
MVHEFHEHDIAICDHDAEGHPPEGHLPRPAAAGGAPAHRGAPRRTDGAPPGIRCVARPMPPAAVRVLETTWRTWREPLA